MSGTTPEAPRRRKVLALLAGGTVLGLGTVVTLAAWTDSEFATGTFTAGTFDLEGAAGESGSTPAFTQNETAPGAPLVFSVDATNLSPGDTTSAPFAVRLATGTTFDASVLVSSEATTGALTGLTYTLTQTASFDCASAVGATLVPAGTTLGTVPADTTFDLAQGAASSPGAPAYLCFTVAAGDDLVSAQTGTATWELLATSTAP